MGKEENFKDKGKPNRFGAENGNDNTKGGRKPSIKNQLKELMMQEGKMKIPKESVISINDDGSVIIKLPTQIQLAMKINQIAMSSKANNIRALQMILEQFDGKPKQSFDFNDDTIKPIEIKRRE